MNLFVRIAIIRKIMLLMAFIPALCSLFIPFAAASASPDTTWSVSFRLNMTGAVDQQIFIPDSDYVSVIMDQGIPPLKLVQGAGYIYTGTLHDELDPGVTYHYQFRINDSLSETINRSVTAQTGMVNITAWWNNEPLNITTFIVNMKYAVDYGMFNPLSDSVCIVGSMNDWQGSAKLQRIDTTLQYEYVDTLLFPGTVQQYKYRINADSSGLELLYKPARIIMIPDTLLEITNDFNNFNPAKRLMTFQCNMGYYIESHHFNPVTDYLDITGNFNGSGANDVLFDVDGDSVYSLELFMDTAWIHQGPLEFKFRINGDPNTIELPGKPNRSYVFHDTINQNPNLYGCYYNNLDPSIPTPPWVYDVNIQGLLIYKKVLSGIYSYENVNGIPEDSTTYRWLRSNNASGIDATPIDSAWKITYVVDTLDIGKWIVFEVTPRAANGDSATGKPVRVVSSNSISAWDVGIGEYPQVITRIYPNPANDFITVETKQEIYRIELINYLNQPVLVKNVQGSTSVMIPIDRLPGGLYILKATTKSGEWGVVRMVKY